MSAAGAGAGALELGRWRAAVSAAKRIAVLTGAGVSAESGLPTFRGREGGLWRKYAGPQLASPAAFAAQPSLVWEFYHHRRESALSVAPNPAHIAIAEFEKRATEEGKSVTIITQNVDDLHRRAGSKNIIELHGNLFKTRCTKCKEITINFDSPICEALDGKGAPDPGTQSADISVKDLPKCKKENCNGLLRPHIVWFGENLETSIIDQADAAMQECDLCLVIGTSSVVYPAAMFAPQAAARGVPVAEFNIEPTSMTNEFQFYFEGKCGTTVPEALSP